MSTPADVDASRHLIPPPNRGGKAVNRSQMAQSHDRPFPYKTPELNGTSPRMIA
ncbi:hypothetical protein [Actinomadura mexicana]|uniref:Uncharacterized protein n=1 Tax=Actinomadura mexicana TaxID=134959 RepID=A0A239DP99_9ACTN|nr:hypothetical protein [Actinomadura mexicana]SNS34320.1 hypothetical protein SAMN06265355_11598 [Actinomadura mexicana]